MKIDLEKLPRERKDFYIKLSGDFGEAEFFGFYFKDGSFLAIDGAIKGDISVICDISGERFVDILDEKLKIKVTNGSYKGFDEEYDIVECDSGIFDFEAFLEDEIKMFQNDYHKKQEFGNGELEI